MNFVDQLAGQYGFANRSEFMRSVLRLLRYKPRMIEEAAVFPFEPPQVRSVRQIIAKMEATGKYTQPFLRSLERGLKRSDYFTS